MKVKDLEGRNRDHSKAKGELWHTSAEEGDKEWGVQVLVVDAEPRETVEVERKVIPGRRAKKR